MAYIKMSTIQKDFEFLQSDKRFKKQEVFSLQDRPIDVWPLGREILSEHVWKGLGTVAD